jgi:hypothetical protein
LKQTVIHDANVRVTVTRKDRERSHVGEMMPAARDSRAKVG